MRKELDDLEAAKWRDICQKARIKWLVECDENSSFFHGSVKNNLKNSRINGLTINVCGRWLRILSNKRF